MRKKRAAWLALALVCAWAPTVVAVGARQPRPRRVLLLHAGEATKDPAERAYSRAVARRLSGWLTELGVPHSVTNDGAAARGALKGVRTAVLCYSPELGSGEREALRNFIRFHGRLIVFYSSDPGLAEMLHMRLGPYTPAARPGQWTGFRFTGPAPALTPERVRQESSNIRPVYPLDRHARILAYWETGDGRPTSIPAWVQSDRGLWMSHVLLESDPAAKKQMLLAFLAAEDPPLWRVAAEKALAAARVGPHPDLARSLEGIAKMAAGGPAAREVAALLARAAALSNQVAQAMAAGRHPQAWQDAIRLRATLVESYARAQSPRAGEFRGVWNHSGTGLPGSDWARTCRVLAAAGLTAVFPNIVHAGTASYPTALLPPARAAARGGDPLADCAAAARASGLEVHAWVICWNMESAPADVLGHYRREGRLQVSAGGAPVNWLCPSHPENLALQLRVIGEIAARYPVQGIHLDFVRYRGADVCFCDGCRRRFESATVARVRNWPADAASGPAAEAYRAWRREQITRLVARARDELRRVRPALKLSAAVYPNPATCRESIGQDWAAWLKDGLVDFVCPMNYTEDPAKFAGFVKSQLALPGAAGRVMPGLGVTASQSRLDAAAVIDQVRALRAAGAAGFMLFDLNDTLERDILTYLPLGLTRR